MADAMAFRTAESWLSAKVSENHEESVETEVGNAENCRVNAAVSLLSSQQVKRYNGNCLRQSPYLVEEWGGKKSCRFPQAMVCEEEFSEAL